MSKSIQLFFLLLIFKKFTFATFDSGSNEPSVSKLSFFLVESTIIDDFAIIKINNAARASCYAPHKYK